MTPSERRMGDDCEPATSASSENWDVKPGGAVGFETTAMKRRHVMPQWLMKL